MPASFDAGIAAPPWPDTTAAAEAPAAGCAPLVDAVPVAAGAPPMPCFCNSINTRFFNASNCCRLDTCARGCDADCTADVAGAAPAMAADAPSAASLAEGWIDPDQTCAPPAADAAVCEPASGADDAAPPTAAPPDVVWLASLAALPVPETAGAAGAAAALTCEAPLAAPTATAAFGAEAAAATGAEAADAAVVAEAPEPAAAAEAASAPDASSAGTVNTAPTRIRLGS
nr:hypothetical protein [Paraburkholderia sediminicola]